MNDDHTDTHLNDRAGWRKVEWGQRYGFSRAFTYKLFAAGNGPRLTRIPGTTVEIVTREADAEWCAELPAAERTA